MIGVCKAKKRRPSQAGGLFAGSFENHNLANCSFG
jgi:hypothetical protein